MFLELSHGDPSVEDAEFFSATQVLKWFMTESFKMALRKKNPYKTG